MTQKLGIKRRCNKPHNLCDDKKGMDEIIPTIVTNNPTHLHFEKNIAIKKIVHG